jgi:DNA-binding transcriptional ArsR family regulator
MPPTRQARPANWISRPAQVRALESPRRQEIVDTLAALGPSSVGALAEHLGRPADTLYFHVRKLLKVGLIREAEQRKSGRHEWAVYALPRPSPAIRYDTVPARSVQRVVAGAVRQSLREFNRAFGLPGVRLGGGDRNVWGGRTKGWLSPEEVVEVNRLLEKLSSLVQGKGPGAGRALHSLAWVFTPAAPVRRAKPKPDGDTPNPGE